MARSAEVRAATAPFVGGTGKPGKCLETQELKAQAIGSWDWNMLESHVLQGFSSSHVVPSDASEGETQIQNENI